MKKPITIAINNFMSEIFLTSSPSALKYWYSIISGLFAAKFLETDWLISLFSSWRLRKNQEGIYQYTVSKPSIEKIQRIKLSVSDKNMLYKTAIIVGPTNADWRRIFLSLLRNLFIKITYLLHFAYRLIISQKFFYVLIFLFVIFTVLHPFEGTAQVDCISAITKYEKFYKIPTGLLKAISKVESEYNPLALNDGIKQHKFKTTQEVLDRINYLKEIGKTNFDIGCMQINYHWHGKNFVSTEKILDISENVRYAASLIYGLYKEHGTWQAAVRHYHSYEPSIHKQYSKKVAYAWLQEKSIK